MAVSNLDDFQALDPFFRIIEEAVAGLVDGEHFFDLLAEDVVFEYVITVPGYPRRVAGRPCGQRDGEGVPEQPLRGLRRLGGGDRQGRARGQPARAPERATRGEGFGDARRATIRPSPRRCCARLPRRSHPRGRFSWSTSPPRASSMTTSTIRSDRAFTCSPSCTA